MIGYYVHHQGAGHLHRACAIAAHCAVPLVGLSSLPRPEGWTGAWHQLPRDEAGVAPPVDVTAGGTLHWAPRRQRGVQLRAHAISTVLVDPEVRLFVSDVSVEAAVLARLHGTRVVVVHQPGRRHDRAHRMAYDLADAILAALPGPGPAWWPESWHAKATHVSAFSRFDQRPAPPPTRARRVLVLRGGGGDPTEVALLDAAAAATPNWAWTVAGPPPRVTAPGPANLRWAGWVNDPWPLLGGAQVVVTHAGQNALAEVAAARRPAIVVPEQRPFDEQLSTGRLLGTVDAALVQARWPDAGAWPQLLAAAAASDPSSWGRWSSGCGAQRAGDRLAALWRAA